MPFRLIDERPLTSFEIEEIENWRNSFVAPRRQLLIGAALAPFGIALSPNAAVSQNSRLAEALIQGGVALSKSRYAIQETIRATFNLVNETSEVQRKPTSASVSTNALGVIDQEFVFAELRPRTVKTIEHSGFQGKVAGSNTYLAETQLSRVGSDFSVQR